MCVCVCVCVCVCTLHLYQQELQQTDEFVIDRATSKAISASTGCVLR